MTDIEAPDRFTDRHTYEEKIDRQRGGQINTKTGLKTIKSTDRLKDEEKIGRETVSYTCRQA